MEAETGGSGDQSTRMLFLDSKNPFLNGSHHTIWLLLSLSLPKPRQTDQTGMSTLMKIFSCKRGCENTPVSLVFSEVEKGMDTYLIYPFSTQISQGLVSEVWLHPQRRTLRSLPTTIASRACWSMLSPQVLGHTDEFDIRLLCKSSSQHPEPHS